MAKEKKTKKHDTFIDMTAMSDMTVLLLTFFMLTATFLPVEPVSVQTPASVSETKIPENNNLMILVDKSGQIFLNLTGGDNKVELLEKMGSRFGISFTDKEKRAFKEDATFAAVPMKDMKAYLNTDGGSRNEFARNTVGVPNDSINGMEFELWVLYALDNLKQKDKDLKLDLSIKSDQNTPYDKISDVTKTLVRIKQNRYNLVTTLTKMPSGL